MQIWQCTIGEAPSDKVPAGSDLLMRRAAEQAYKTITGEAAKFLFSGWDAQLSVVQRQIIEDAKPKIIELWVEGYNNSQLDSAEACFLGNFDGPTLSNAVLHYNHKASEIPLIPLGHARRFFNNEADAREAFG